jgi:serine protease AprX
MNKYLQDLIVHPYYLPNTVVPAILVSEQNLRTMCCGTDGPKRRSKEIATRSSSSHEKCVGPAIPIRVTEDEESDMNSKLNTWGKILLLLLACFLLGKPAFAKHSKIAAELDAANPDSDVDVIVQFTQTPTARHHAKVLNRGGQLKSELGVVKGGAYKLRASKLAELANDPEVAHISVDHSLRGTKAAAPTGAMLDYYDAAVNAPFGWQMGLDGSGIGVAVIDSGIIDIPDLHGSKYRVVYSQNFAGSGSANDVFGHGSHVAGIVGGGGQNSTGSNYFYTFKGIAPNVNLINLRVLDQNGNGTDSAVISAIQQAISLKDEYNIRVINLSLGRPVYESYTLDPLCQAVESAWNAGIVVVVAAGNNGRDNSQGTDGYGTVSAPGNDPYVITVGAMKTMGTPTRSDDLIASYSSKGPTAVDYVAKPDLVAPGNLIISLYRPWLTLPRSYPGNEIPYSLFQNNRNSTSSFTYYRLSGTSMAAPMVSGAAALMLQQNPSLTPDQVKARLMLTAYKVFPPSSIATDPVTGQAYVSYYDVFTVGAGYLDIQAALNNTDVAVGNALSPTVTFDSASGNVYLISAARSVWGTTSLWATRSVWGTTQMEDGIAGESTAAVGDNSAIQAFVNLPQTRSVWGTGTSLVDATSIFINGE